MTAFLWICQLPVICYETEHQVLNEESTLYCLRLESELLHDGNVEQAVAVLTVNADNIVGTRSHMVPWVG